MSRARTQILIPFKRIRNDIKRPGNEVIGMETNLERDKNEVGRSSSPRSTPSSVRSLERTRSL